MHLPVLTANKMAGFFDLGITFFHIFAIIFLRTAIAGIPGINTPISIDPKVDIDDNLWLLDLYPIILGRSQDAEGYRTNLNALQRNGQTRNDIYNAFVNSKEFQSNPSLQDPSMFITRVYNTLLHRSPSNDEIKENASNLKNWNGDGRGNSWLEEIDNVYYSREYKNVNCQTSYYSYGSQVNDNTLLLHDLFEGKARMQPQSESELISIDMPSALRQWDQKLPVFKAPGDASGYIGFTRAYLQEPSTFSIALLTSPDGVHFSEVGLLWTPESGHTFYDAHVSIDNSVCPPRYVMAMECVGKYHASVCISSTTKPTILESWFYPKVIVDGVSSPNLMSASTGVTLTDGEKKYVSWTQVYETGENNNDPNAHTFSQSASVKSFYDSYYFGTVIDKGVNVMMSAEPKPWCTSAWDCNNRDKQDWKKEGDFFYALYNGANYYRCNGTWGLSISRSNSATGNEYVDRLPISLGILADRSDTCGVSYIVLNVIGGEPYLYYAFVQASGVNEARRSKIISL